MGGILKPVVNLLTGGLLNPPQAQTPTLTEAPVAAAPEVDTNVDAAIKEDGENEALTRARSARKRIENKKGRDDLRVDLSNSLGVSTQIRDDEDTRPTRAGIQL